MGGRGGGCGWAGWCSHLCALPGEVQVLFSLSWLCQGGDKDASIAEKEEQVGRVGTVPVNEYNVFAFC